MNTTNEKEPIEGVLLKANRGDEIKRLIFSALVACAATVFVNWMNAGDQLAANAELRKSISEKDDLIHDQDEKIAELTKGQQEHADRLRTARQDPWTGSDADRMLKGVNRELDKIWHVMGFVRPEPEADAIPKE